MANSAKVALTLGSVFVGSVSALFLPLLLYATPFSPKQTLAQKPQDTPIRVLTQDNRSLCYAPTFSGGASYIALSSCQGAMQARYDVFSRLAYYIKDTWLCITAPDSVVERKRDKDYVHLSPCAINLPSQQWQLKDNRFYSLDGIYSIQDDGGYLYAAHTFAGGLYTHTLESSMQKWASTIAAPANLTIQSAISWSVSYAQGQERYFLTNNQSQKNTAFLYYNLLSGHIASYDESSGRLYCMYSNTGKQAWDWVVWGLCTDGTPPKDNRAFFKPIPIDDRHFAFLDKDSNILRLTRYGIHWGVPYVASKEYASNDVQNSPTSAFELDHTTQEWLRFISANIGENLRTCPAPGHKHNPLQNSSKQILQASPISTPPRSLLQYLLEHLLAILPTQSAKGHNKQNPLLQQPFMQSSPALPAYFSLNESWVARLWHINISADTSRASSGVCGICLLQAYQAIAELLETHAHPRGSGGYFFDTGAGVNPFASFYARNSLLHDTLQDILGYYDSPARDHRELFYRGTSRALASSISMLPQYEWSVLGQSVEESGIYTLLQSVLERPVGSVFLFTLVRLDPLSGRNLGHAVAALRLRDGVVIIPANAPSLSLESFRARVQAVQNPADMIERLTRFGSRHLELLGLGVLEVARSHRNPFESIISLHNCSGEGEDRRGNALLPLPELLNACISGRCVW